MRKKLITGIYTSRDGAYIYGKMYRLICKEHVWPRSLVHTFKIHVRPVEGDTIKKYRSMSEFIDDWDIVFKV